MVEEALRRIGLTEGEIKVYLALLELGSTTSGKITRKCGISGSKVYEVIDRLMKKGLASSVEQNGVKHFESTSPERLMDYLDEKGKQIHEEQVSIQKVIPQLLLRHKETKKSTARVFTGWEGLKTANEDIISTLKKGQEWLSMGLTGQPKSWEAYFTHRQEIRAKKGIILKHLLNKKYASLYEKRKKLHHTQYRFLPRSFEMPTSIEIYGKKVLIMILLKEDPIAIQIESDAVSVSFRKYFYALWKTYSKYPR